MSDAIAAAAPFYGMVLDEWIDSVTNITVPIYLFFGGVDPFIPQERVKQIESRFKEIEYSLNANYWLNDSRIFVPSGEPNCGGCNTDIGLAVY